MALNINILTFKAALKEARASFDLATTRLSQITEESQELTREIEQLRRTITALAAMCSEEPAIDSLGITESCMEIMRAEKGTVTTADVVRALEERGFDISSQKNAHASVHAVLSRLAKKEKIRRDTDGKDTVTWKGPNYDPFADVPF